MRERGREVEREVERVRDEIELGIETERDIERVHSRESTWSH
jgi:hypothetical protein